MQKNTQEIKKALEVLSHVSREDYEGMEAEFFATVAKLSADYESHVRYSIANNSIQKYIKSNIPSCPKCNDRDSVNIAAPTIELRYFTPYLDRKNEAVYMYTESDEVSAMKNYLCSNYSKFQKDVKESMPDNSYLLEEHLFCSNCRLSFPPNDFVKNIWDKKLFFSDIVEWSKNNGTEDEVE